MNCLTTRACFHVSGFVRRLSTLFPLLAAVILTGSAASGFGQDAPKASVKDSPLARLDPAKIDRQKYADLPKEVVAVFAPAEGNLYHVPTLPDPVGDVVLVHRLTNAAIIAAVAVSPDGLWVAASGVIPIKGAGLADKRKVRYVVHLWEVAGPQAVALEGHTEPVTGLSFTPDGKTLASGSLDGTVRLWRLDGQVGKVPVPVVLEGRKHAAVRALAFSPDGKTLACNVVGVGLRLWGMAGVDPEESTIWAVWGRSLAFSADGTALVGGNDQGYFQTWDLTGKTPKRGPAVDWGVKDERGGYVGWTRGAALSQDGSILVGGGSVRGQSKFKRWNLRGDKPLEAAWLPGEPAGDAGASDSIAPLSVAFLPDGKTIVTACQTHIRVYDIDGSALRSLQLPSHAIEIAAAGDGRHLVVGSGNLVYVVRLIR